MLHCYSYSHRRLQFGVAGWLAGGPFGVTINLVTIYEQDGCRRFTIGTESLILEQAVRNGLRALIAD